MSHCLNVCHLLKQVFLVSFAVSEVDLKLKGCQLLGLLQGDWQRPDLHYTLALFKLHVQMKQIPSNSN